MTTNRSSRSLAHRLTLLGAATVTVAAIAGASVGLASAGTGAGGSPGQTVVIDATKDPTSAKDALKLYPGAKNTAFTPTAAPVYATTSYSQVKLLDGRIAPAVAGGTDQPVTETLEITHDQHSSWSLGGSVETSVGFDVVEAVDVELSAKFTANHTWEKSESDSQTIKVTALPGKLVWIQASNSTATVTGDFTFDINGVHYDVENVSITQAASPVTGTEAAASYRVRETTRSAAGLSNSVPGGLVQINKLPKLTALIQHQN